MHQPNPLAGARLRILVIEDGAAEGAAERMVGRLSSGVLRIGDRLRLQPSGRAFSVGRIVVGHDDLDRLDTGQVATLFASHAVNSRIGDLISAADDPAGVADQFQVRVRWSGRESLLPGRRYGFDLCGQKAVAEIGHLKFRSDETRQTRLAAATLLAGEAGVLNLALDRPVAFDPYAENPETGAFVLTDLPGGPVVARGMIDFALRRASNIHLQALDIDKAARARLMGQKGCVVWLTGLSASGKSTIANLIEKKLYGMGHHTYILDGDNVRHGLNKDLGFTAADRVENIRRIAEVARLMVDAGLIVVTAFISPFRAERQMARSLFNEGEFHEVFVDTPLALAEERDPKGLYKKARRGELRNFTGIDSPYETPETPEIRIDTATLTAEQAADTIVERLASAGLLSAEN
jgi:bifunctional enzyme CysN/CysC